MDEPLGVLGTPDVGFFTLIIIGGLAGWIAGMILGIRHGILTNILVGIVGSWIGSYVADNFLHLAVAGSGKHFLAALAGSIIVLLIWQLIHGRSAYPQQ